MVVPDIHPVTSPLPDERDVGLAVALGHLSLRYTACLTAAMIFVQVWPGPVTVHGGRGAGSPRLPNERLYLHP